MLSETESDSDFGFLESDEFKEPVKTKESKKGKEPNMDDRTGIYILVDNRERKIHHIFDEVEQYGIPYYIEHVTTGDMAICCNGKIMNIIERKTLKDLAASLRDGRITNMDKMTTLREETGCKVSYLIVGPKNPKETRKFGRISYKSLQSHLDHAQFLHNVFVLKAATEQEGVQRLFTMARNYETMDLSEYTKGGGHESLLKKKHEPTDEVILRNMWCSIPCITHNNLTNFLDNYTLHDLFSGKITKDEISVMRYPSGVTIGPKKAKKILDATNDQYIIGRMLAEIPGITKKTAGLILDKYSFTKIWKRASDPEKYDKILKKIASIKKTPKRKIGEAVAKKLLKFIIS